MKWTLCGTAQKIKKTDLRTKENHSVGIILFRHFPRSLKYLLIKQHQGHWGFPKGHIEAGERFIDTAIRELYEETGIKKISFLRKKIFLRDDYYFKKETVKVHKIVDYFIAGTETVKVKIDGDEILNFKWCTYEKAVEKLTFQESKKILKQATKIIRDYL
jgi:8-oxo-dGTP pyrophosphatase MutT (NUDIX family)